MFAIIFQKLRKRNLFTNNSFLAIDVCVQATCETHKFCFGGGGVVGGDGGGDGIAGGDGVDGGDGGGGDG